MPPPLPLIAAQTEVGALGLNGLLRPTATNLTFAARALPSDLLEELNALMAVGPGMTGSSPTHMALATTAADKARLAEALDPAQQAAVLDAPACAVIAYDQDFAEQMLAFAADGLDGRSCLDAPAKLRAAVLRNSVLQGAYLAVSARTLGVEAIFLPNFDAAAVTAAFFPEPGLEVIFIAALGFPAEPVS
jgi:nitroreductase